MSKVLDRRLGKDAFFQVATKTFHLQVIEQRTKVFQVFRSCGPTDQNVIYIDSYTLEVTGQLVHDFLEITRSQSNAKRESHLK